MHLGIDIGSVSVKLVLINRNLIILKSFYLPHQGQPYLTAFNLLKELNQEFILSEIKSTMLTGSGGEFFAQILELPKINELIAQTISSNFLYPQVKTIIEVGGEDSKLIILENSKGESNIQDFAINSICAAGTGSFLTEQAKRFGITIEEFSRLATASLNPPRIAGRCSVFAKSDMIHLQQKATPLEDIIAGLCYALVRNFISTIIKGKKITSPIAFQGGVAGNQGIAKAFIDLLNISKENLIISKYHALTGALGCALESLKTKKENSLNLKKLEEYLKKPPLEHSSSLLPLNEYTQPSIYFYHPKLSSKNKINVYLGVDVGSISTNLAVLDENKNLIAKRYLMTAGKPLEAVKQGLKEIGEELKDKIEIGGVCTTGSGRYLTADFIGADLIKNEITAQAKASVEIDPEVDTIFEIGGQDSKYISLENGVIIDFEMNKACAAGTGSFLEEQAEKLGVNIKENFSRLAFQSNCPTCMGERCTVFIESDINYHKLKGTARENLTAGLSYSIVYNYLNKVVGNRKIGERIFFQGGVAFNKAVASAFEKITAKKIAIPPHHEVTGAIGCALMAKEYMQNNKKSKFKGFDLGEKKYQIKSFQCKSCPNTCEINQVNIEKEQPLFYGSRCEKYERREIQNNLPNLFKEREKLLWSQEDFKYILTFGIPRTLHFYEYFPFWYNLFKYLEIKIILSDRTNKEIINSGLESTLAESCFPVKVAHGHFLNLIKKKPDFIFIPSIINLPKIHPNYKESVPCPYVQSIPYTLGAAFYEKLKEIKLLTPLIEFNYPAQMHKNLKNLLKKINLNPKNLNKAIKEGISAQEKFDKIMQDKAKDILKNLRAKNPIIVIISRPYNGGDQGINMELPRKLISLGAVPLPLECLPVEKIPLYEKWPDLSWRYGQKILAASEFIKEKENLQALYLTNFGCGPDSFLLKFFQKSISPKKFLTIEVDEHNADAGIITRCEAFLDSLKNIKAKSSLNKQKIDFNFKKDERTLFIPYMCDHAYALESAFLACGVKAEVIPPSNQETLSLGRKYTLGKECYPAIITTGDMLKVIKNNDPKKIAFFMPTAGGGCRFGYYHKLHSLILEELNLKIPIFAPSQNDNFYRDFGLSGSNFIYLAYLGILAIDLLDKALRETRPYEKEKGESEKEYKIFLEKIKQCILNKQNLLPIMKEARYIFEKIKVPSLKVKIGIVGEIFVRSHSFSNENLVKKLENLGAEVHLPPIFEWLFYLNYLRKKEYLKNKNYLKFIKNLIEEKIQIYEEERLSKAWEGYLNLPEPTAKENINSGSLYLDPSFEGEAILSLGKARDYIKKGISGIINVMPFTCMPGTIVNGMLKKFKIDHQNIPTLNLAYDGSEQSQTEIKLEAFIYQAKNYAKN